MLDRFQKNKYIKVSKLQSLRKALEFAYKKLRHKCESDEAISQEDRGYFSSCLKDLEMVIT